MKEKGKNDKNTKKNIKMKQIVEVLMIMKL